MWELQSTLKVFLPKEIFPPFLYISPGNQLFALGKGFFKSIKQKNLKSPNNSQLDTLQAHTE
jgi:hypothetical protein